MGAARTTGASCIAALVAKSPCSGRAGRSIRELGRARPVRQAQVAGRDGTIERIGDGRPQGLAQAGHGRPILAIAVRSALAGEAELQGLVR